MKKSKKARRQIISNAILKHSVRLRFESILAEEAIAEIIKKKTDIIIYILFEKFNLQFTDAIKKRLTAVNFSDDKSRELIILDRGKNEKFIVEFRLSKAPVNANKIMLPELIVKSEIDVSHVLTK